MPKHSWSAQLGRLACAGGSCLEVHAETFLLLLASIALGRSRGEYSSPVGQQPHMSQEGYHNMSES